MYVIISLLQPYCLWNSKVKIESNKKIVLIQIWLCGILTNSFLFICISDSLHILVNALDKEP